jgi:hypothetical protein
MIIHYKGNGGKLDECYRLSEVLGGWRGAVVVVMGRMKGWRVTLKYSIQLFRGGSAKGDAGFASLENESP